MSHFSQFPSCIFLCVSVTQFSSNSLSLFQLVRSEHTSLSAHLSHFPPFFLRINYESLTWFNLKARQANQKKKKDSRKKTIITRQFPLFGGGKTSFSWLWLWLLGLVFGFRFGFSFKAIRLLSWRTEKPNRPFLLDLHNLLAGSSISIYLYSYFS